MTLPSPKVVTLGYQRPSAMFAVLVKVFVAGSKIAACGCPKKGSYWMVPPSISAVPSCRRTIPLQNMSQDSENCVMAPDTGFNSNAPELFDGP